MREIQASEAKARFAELLDDVERGETIVISRHGRPIARLEPEASRRQAEIDAAIDAILALRKETGRMTVEEIISAKNEGRD